MTISGTYQTQHGELTIIQYNEIIMATYQEDGCCSGVITGNTVNGIWKNKKDSGIFCWNFDAENSFSGNYKSGLTEGAMRGKWDGKRTSSQEKNTNQFELQFEIINDSNQQSELTISISETLLDVSGNSNVFSPDDYNTIITNPKVLAKCKSKIELEDVYFLENSSFYSMRLKAINELSLQFLWNKENEPDYIKKALAFFKLDATTNQDEVDEKIEEFIDDYYTSLDYVKSF